MAYKLMIKLIANGKTSKEELLNKADVYYAAGRRLTDEQYTEVVRLIGEQLVRKNQG